MGRSQLSIAVSNTLKLQDWYFTLDTLAEISSLFQLTALAVMGSGYTPDDLEITGSSNVRIRCE